MINRFKTRVTGLPFIVVLNILFISCASTAPLPQPLNIISPAADTPKEISAFSGVWEGKWNGLLDTYLVVEEINIKTARIIVSIGASSSAPDGMYFYATTNVLPGPALEWTDPEGNKYTYKMEKGLNKILAHVEEKATGARFPTYMVRKKHE